MWTIICYFSSPVIKAGFWFAEKLSLWLKGCFFLFVCFRLSFSVAEVGKSLVNEAGNYLKRRWFHGLSSGFFARTVCFLFFKEFLSFGAGWAVQSCQGCSLAMSWLVFLLTNLRLWAWSVKTLDYSAYTLILQSTENNIWLLKKKGPRSSWIKWSTSEDLVHQLLCVSSPVEETTSHLFLL